MSYDEFDLINRYFKRPNLRPDDVLLGIGDDAAITQVPGNKRLAIATDTLLQNVHFSETITPQDLGHRVLAVNLSDLAAMGAEPAWATLALTLPEYDESWLQNFSAGFFQLADAHKIQLIGGDTTRGALVITVQVIGFLGDDIIRRDGAKVGDEIYLTGGIGGAAIALNLSQSQKTIPDNLASALERPTPRVQEALCLAPYVNAGIDISDGLTADLNHILSASKLGASIYLDALPAHPDIMNFPIEMQRNAMLYGGDDYELCVTIPSEHVQTCQFLMNKLDCRFSQIGTIEQRPGLRGVQDGVSSDLAIKGYQHF